MPEATAPRDDARRQTTRLTGRCHCGNLELVLDTPTAIDELPVRACACSFCTKHGVRTTSDPRGRVRIVVRDPQSLLRYRFGLRTADFLVCKRCGVYLAAVMTTEQGTYATLNLNTFDGAERFTRAAAPVSYDTESEAARIARRESGWTPVVAIEEHAVQESDRDG